MSLSYSILVPEIINRIPTHAHKMLNICLNNIKAWTLVSWLPNVASTNRTVTNPNKRTKN